MSKTPIEYLDDTWNPLAMRCTPVSAGCEHCWHLRMADRLRGNMTLSEGVRGAYAGDDPVLVEHKLTQPLRRKKPTVYGVQFMGDLFHKAVPFDSVDHVFAAMARCKQHTFVNFTKRPERMEKYLKRWLWWGSGEKPDPVARQPLPNFVAGTSIENQATANERIGHLLRCPAACRVLSVEPMLGEVNIHVKRREGEWTFYDRPLTGFRAHACGGSFPPDAPKIHGVICGGETGPGSRPMKPDWVRSLRDQCVDAGVPFYFKSWGTGDKSLTGRLLDGREWNELAWERKEKPA